jgi:hypothetical protein
LNWKYIRDWINKWDRKHFVNMKHELNRKYRVYRDNDYRNDYYHYNYFRIYSCNLQV